MRNILIGILIQTLYSCQFIGGKYGIELTIENKSDFPIENVRLSTSENIDELKFDKIELTQEVSNFLNMKDNKNDGHYLVEFTQKGRTKAHDFGYYTNGRALEKSLKIEIQNDTINVKFNGKEN